MLRRYFPFDAEYSIVVRVRGNPAPGLPASKLDVRLDGKRVKLIDADIDTAEANQGTRSIEVRMPLPAGEHFIGAGFLSESAKLETGGAGGRGGATPTPPPSPNGVSVEYISIGGPYHPTGPGDTESRRRIFICRPRDGEPESACARQILSSLARRAYRRPVTAADTDPLMTVSYTHLDVYKRQGLSGSYEMTLDWAPDDAPANDATPGPSIFTALQEQLGLRLDSAKGPVEMLVIDRAERIPTEN